MQREVQLKGGRVTQGVVRVGDTVRRPCGSHSPFVHRLLLHLEENSFQFAPRFLGLDSEQREILTYIKGQVPLDLGWFSDSQIRAAAQIIRQFHEATAGADLADSHEVVCHGDFSPCNFVFQSGMPTCIIDFDAAFPGPRRVDVGYAIWLWLDIGNPELDPYETGRRIAAFLDAYGSDVLVKPIVAIIESQDLIIDRNVNMEDSFPSNLRQWARQCRDWVIEYSVELEAGLIAAPPTK